MNIGKKAALLTAAAGALVFVGAGAASAHNFGSDLGAIQTNTCDTATGAIASTGVAAPTGEINVGSDCINFTNSGAVFQSNDCDTAAGPIVALGTAAPTGDINVGSNCANIAVDDSQNSLHH
ncbi:hypothetical protein [Streptomyces sp. Rer75]|uniref:hypothetical protein n=1 Tax=unclassified Streptomyces TaxID=2593676 RepID=UPI0015D0A024|nr:hypothetical protein [Streptomyces sp. Rer75]QLH23191.1 hypothetical protein HYQ63_23340 [Streptomyces sp. Rer75]